MPNLRNGSKGIQTLAVVCESDFLPLSYCAPKAILLKPKLSYSKRVGNVGWFKKEKQTTSSMAERHRVLGNILTH